MTKRLSLIVALGLWLITPAHAFLLIGPITGSVTPSVVATNVQSGNCGGVPIYTTCAFTANGLVTGTTAYFATYAYTGDGASPGTYIPVSSVTGTGLSSCVLVPGANSYNASDSSTDNIIQCAVTSGGSPSVTVTWSAAVDYAYTGVVDVSPALTDSGFGNGVSTPAANSTMTIATNGSLVSGIKYFVLTSCYGGSPPSSVGTGASLWTGGTLTMVAQWRDVTGAGAADTETMSQSASDNWNCEIAAAHP
jgi:hypothetical protein